MTNINNWHTKISNSFTNYTFGNILHACRRFSIEQQPSNVRIEEDLLLFPRLEARLYERL